VVDLDGAPARPVEETDGLADPDWAHTRRLLVPRPDELLPDLEQRAPSELVVVGSGRRARLGFASATANRGRGPLVINGVRRGGGPMVAHQVVERRGALTLAVRDVGRLHYELHAPHYHWHLQSFVRYELRRASDFRLVGGDRKTGFCLIDRWGRASPGVHGQDLRLGHLRAGRYVLVHRANPERTMRELRYSDSAASVLLHLSWPGGRSSAPRVSVLRRCEASERCPVR
jgi:hypothetical protein